VDHRDKPGDDSICEWGWIASLALAMTDAAVYDHGRIAYLTGE
jgi:hypothetical protein